MVHSEVDGLDSVREAARGLAVAVHVHELHRHDGDVHVPGHPGDAAAVVAHGPEDTAHLGAVPRVVFGPAVVAGEIIAVDEYAPELGVRKISTRIDDRDDNLGSGLSQGDEAPRLFEAELCPLARIWPVVRDILGLYDVIGLRILDLSARLELLDGLQSVVHGDDHGPFPGDGQGRCGQRTAGFELHDDLVRTILGGMERETDQDENQNRC
ncbi:MAG: hypothetical protein BWX71_00552 [Deltaproteobacteria bacterium ADurb.Bin072]|nr:MAG: hypothetical protein BWX71_00552 [Deltaproteobacteria bacterium ADurb.Bin072]